MNNKHSYLNNADRISVKILGDQRRNHAGGVDRNLRALDDARVTGTDSSDQRSKHQADGIVPRRDEKRLQVHEYIITCKWSGIPYNSVGLGLNVRGSGE